MTAQQIKSIVSSALAQARGASAVTTIDTSDIVSLGQTIFNNGWQNDFLSALTDKIGKEIIINRPYSTQLKAILKDAFTFGAILRKIDVEPLEPDYDRSWSLLSSTDPDGLGGTDNGNKAGVFVIKKPTVHQNLFVQFATWSFEVSIPDVQLRSAFSSAEDMAAFIDAIMVELDNSINESVDDVARLNYSTFIACAIVKTYGTGASKQLAFNLLSDYNTMFGQSLTASEAKHDTEFMKFATKQINLVAKRMRDRTILYNANGRKRFTPTENLVLTMTSDFVSSYESYLQADTFNNEMTKLQIPYTEVNYWQGTGTAYADYEKVYITTPALSIASETAAEHVVQANGVVATLFDDRALGVTVVDRYSATERDNLKRIAQYKDAANIGFYCDLSENGVVFLVADSNPVVDPT